MHLIHSTTGLIHLIAALAALALGLFVFVFTRKGSRIHKQLGYGYVVAMAVLNISAFFIFYLFGGFGPFHIAALISGATLLVGFVPVYLKRPRDRWLSLHYEFMGWSYIGLLAAFCAEVAVRVPSTPFWGGIIGSSLVIFVLGGIVIARARARFIPEPVPQERAEQ